jgi:hypothetical protein
MSKPTVKQMASARIPRIWGLQLCYYGNTHDNKEHLAFCMVILLRRTSAGTWHSECLPAMCWGRCAAIAASIATFAGAGGERGLGVVIATTRRSRHRSVGKLRLQPAGPGYDTRCQPDVGPRDGDYAWRPAFLAILRLNQSPDYQQPDQDQGAGGRRHNSDCACGP